MSKRTSTTFATDLDLYARGLNPEEPIIAIEFPSSYNKIYNYSVDNQGRDKDPRDRAITEANLWDKTIAWTIAHPYLNYQYDDGCGGLDCHPVLAYTASNVIYIWGYGEGALITHVPRNFQLSQI